MGGGGNIGIKINISDDYLIETIGKFLKSRGNRKTSKEEKRVRLVVENYLCSDKGKKVISDFILRK